MKFGKDNLEMTFRGERLDLAQMIASHDARIRELETLMGGGVQSQIKAAEVAALEGTISADYTDLDTPGPSVTVRVGRTGRVINFIVSGTRADGFSNPAGVSVEITTASGGIIQLADDREAFLAFVHTEGSDAPQRSMSSSLVEGLPAEDLTFMLKYRSDGIDNVRFYDRLLIVIPF